MKHKNNKNSNVFMNFSPLYLRRVSEMVHMRFKALKIEKELISF